MHSSSFPPTKCDSSFSFVFLVKIFFQFSSRDHCAVTRTAAQRWSRPTWRADESDTPQLIRSCINYAQGRCCAVLVWHNRFDFGSQCSDALTRVLIWISRHNGFRVSRQSHTTVTINYIITRSEYERAYINKTRFEYSERFQLIIIRISQKRVLYKRRRLGDF